MLIRDIFRLSTRMFRTSRSRTVLTILGIGVGIGAILFLVSLGYGLQKLILEQITTSDALLSLDVTAGDLENLKLGEDALREISGVENIEEVSPVITTEGQMHIGDISTEIDINFVDSNFFRLDGTKLSAGDFYPDNDNSKIIISSAALRLFGLEIDDSIGKKAQFTLFVSSQDEEGNVSRDSLELEDDFEIVGVIDEDSLAYVYVPFSVSKITGIKNFSKIKAKVDKDKNLNIVRNAILEKGFVVSALSDVIDQANQIFQIVQIILGSFGIIALIVSAIGMFNTMTITLLERTQEIGIMKALGATAFDVWNMFLAESVIIGFVGGLGGIIIGFVGGELFNYGLNFLARALGGEAIDMFYTPMWFILLIITFSTFVGFITGFYPARRAAKINSLEALRYK